jgi:hypothetical protein
VATEYQLSIEQVRRALGYAAHVAAHLIPWIGGAVGCCRRLGVARTIMVGRFARRIVNRNLQGILTPFLLPSNTPLPLARAVLPSIVIE